MNPETKASIKTLLLCLAGLLVALGLWPYAIAGLLSFIASGMRFNRWVSSVAALGVTAGWRIATGEWHMRIGENTSGIWYFDIPSFIVSWVLAAIFVAGFAMSPGSFMEGYRERSHGR